jgi:hypothetical protein
MAETVLQFRDQCASHAASALDEQMGTASALDLMETVMAFITGL